MKKFAFAFLIVMQSAASYGQDIYVLKSGTVSFFAGTAMEDINASNDKAISFLNIKTGEITISIPNKEFHFKRSLMEEHFNENYMESSKFPKSEFKGKINDILNVNLNSKDPVRVTATGVLTIHGVSKERTIDVMLLQKNSLLEGNTKFVVPLEDHNIDRPKILWEKLADKVEVAAKFIYEPYKK